MAAESKATTQNPKDLLGNKKVPVGAVLPVAIAHEACAMLDGELKYGYRNWREKKVIARIYIDACKRHLDAWEEGEEYAQDSGVHHLGHARACLGILLDAQETGNLIDDRAPGVFSRVAARLEEWVSKRRQKAVADAEAKAKNAYSSGHPARGRICRDPNFPLDIAGRLVYSGESPSRMAGAVVRQREGCAGYSFREEIMIKAFKNTPVENLWYGIKVLTIFAAEIVSIITGFVSLMSLFTGQWEVGALAGIVCAFAAYMTRSITFSLMHEDEKREAEKDQEPPDDGCAA